MPATTQQLCDSFLRRLAADVRAGLLDPATVEWYRSQLKKLTAAVGSVPAEELRSHHLVEMTMTNALARGVRRVFKWASEEDIIQKDPFTRLKIPPCGERERTLSRAEMVKLYRASPRILRRLLLLLRHTMARPGEIRGLRWSQVDFENRYIVLQEFKGKKRRKDKARNRVIALDTVAVRFLRAMYARANPAFVARACEPSPSKPIFISRDGKPWSPNAVRCSMRTARVKAGLMDTGERVVCYTLRHTAATTATENGIPQKVLAEMMGHTRTETTERYQHVKADHLKKMINQATARPR